MSRGRGRSSPLTTPEVPAHELVTTPEQLEAVVDELVEQPRYAIDTEFHREKTYFPALGLVQLAWPGSLVLVDAVALDDVTPLRRVLESDAVAVVHAADQDLEVLEVATGAVPGQIFDTQLAAGFVGMSTPSLSALHERELALRLGKGDRLTDWLARPLTDDQLRYAASDVAWLLEVADSLERRLTDAGRLQWALDECEALRLRQRGARDPEVAWRRIKEARQLRGQARSVARAVAAWREEEAARQDQPVRFVLPDIAIISMANRPPKDVGALKKVRGIDGRHLRKGQAERLLEVVAAGRSVEPPPARDVDPQLDRNLRPAITLVSAWVSQLARDLDLDTALLATRQDIEDLLSDVPTARLRQGWRAELVGEPIRRLVAGEAALAFDGAGGLVLEPRVVSG